MMKRQVGNTIASLVIILIVNTISFASTAFMAEVGDKVMTGRNGDSDKLNVIMHVLPPSDGKYGRIYLGAEDSGGFYYTTGLNDQGLWYGSTSLYDGAALPERHDIYNHDNKPTWPYELSVKVIEECTTVDEAIEIYKTYFTPHWNGHTLFVDRYGNSVIVEYGEKDVAFIRRENHFQVMSNFPNADTLNARWYNCYRYKTAESMLSDRQDISTDLFRTICDAVHQEGPSPTSLSTVYDAIKGRLYIYYFYYFEEHLVFNVNEELTNGESFYHIPQHFNQIKVRSPINGESVNPSSVTFSWNGNADTYLLYYSTDPNFDDVTPILSTKTKSPLTNFYNLSSIILGSLFFISIWLRRKKLRFVFIACIVVNLYISCDMGTISSPFAPSTIEHYQTVENLQPDTHYYWKVVAIGTKGINSESIVHKFETKN
jgi:hypothetical protein